MYLFRMLHNLHKIRLFNVLRYMDKRSSQQHHFVTHIFKQLIGHFLVYTRPHILYTHL